MTTPPDFGALRDAVIVAAGVASCDPFCPYPKLVKACRALEDAAKTIPAVEPETARGVWREREKGVPKL